MSQTDATTEPAPKRQHADRMRRLAELRDAMPTGVTADLNDETINAIAEKLEARVRGTR